METFADGYREPIRGAAYKTNPCTAMTDVISIGGCSCIHLVNGLTDYLFFILLSAESEYRWLGVC